MDGGDERDGREVAQRPQRFDVLRLGVLAVGRLLLAARPLLVTLPAFGSFFKSLVDKLLKRVYIRI